ncbi:MAG: hypothetical protein ACI910_002632 [Oleispira sp.]|jgi:hypothetical protein
MKPVSQIVFSVRVLFMPIIAISFTSACSDYNHQEKEPKVIESSLSRDGIPALAYLEHDETYNAESVIPPQCYTKTDGDKNPCYVCHQTYTDPLRPNFVKDGSLQGNYEFSDEGMTNSWKNLFKDRSKEIDAIDDQTIMNWVSQDNYSSFIKRLNNDSSWKGEMPEIKNLAYPKKAFYENGIAKDGSHWIAYNYKPLPSSFWPTNGSTGDAMIRLPKEFRELEGQYSEALYLQNLALLEQSIKQTQKEDQANNPHVYLGDASNINIEYMLYPKGTEFLHTVRYLGINEDESIYNAPRMKEVRYMKKAKFKSISALKSSYFIEAKEKILGQLPQTINIGDRGIDNGFGWILNGYIENKKGELRQQNKQEMASCNGCHKTLGSTIDQVFSFSRKLEGRQGWGYIDLTKITDVPNIIVSSEKSSKGNEKGVQHGEQYGDQYGEYLTYFQRVGGGDEFRQNSEMLTRWFHDDGQVNKEAVEALASIYPLITPSKERALALNKTYKLIVAEQSYIFGRDAVLKPAKNVLKKVEETMPLKEQHRYSWDIRLNWNLQ